MLLTNFLCDAQLNHWYACKKKKLNKFNGKQNSQAYILFMI